MESITRVLRPCSTSIQKSFYNVHGYSTLVQGKPLVAARYMFCALWMLLEAAALLGQNLPNYLLTWMAVMDGHGGGGVGVGCYSAVSRCNEQCTAG